MGRAHPYWLGSNTSITQVKACGIKTQFILFEIELLSCELHKISLFDTYEIINLAFNHRLRCHPSK
jgi:hypothetical protein